MSAPVTRKGKSATRGNARVLVALRRARAPARTLIGLREMGARRAWAAAVRARKSVQQRIVCAFRKHIEGSGPGPTDAELLMFARLAVAEQRLGRSLARAKVERYCGNAQTFSDPAAILRRGEHQ
jgi:hypothetical protein